MSCGTLHEKTTLDCNAEKYEVSGVCYVKFFPDTIPVTGTLNSDMLDADGYLNFRLKIPKCDDFLEEDTRAIITLLKINEDYKSGSPMENSFIISADYYLVP